LSSYCLFFSPLLFIAHQKVALFHSFQYYLPTERYGGVGSFGAACSGGLEFKNRPLTGCRSWCISWHSAVPRTITGI